MMIGMGLALAAVMGLQQQTDTTFAVPAGARLRLDNHSGSVRVSSWDRQEMRVRAQHGSRDVIEINTSGAVVRVQAERSRGMANFVEYDITVPRSMAVDLGGVETDLTVEGVAGDISASSVEGDVTIRGAGGAVTVSTVEGDIIVDGGRGRLAISGTDGDVTITGAHGEISVGTVEGNVTLENVESANVDVSTVDGDITYHGTVQDDGRYRLTSHDGDITLSAPAGINATVSVATFDGSFEADPAFHVQISEMRPGRRFSFTLGSGSARMELETFDGEIRIEKR